MNTQIDEVPVSSLPDRYSVARSQIYNRINALGIETLKRGNKAYVDAGHLAQLDQLHECLNRGMTLNEAAAAVRQDSLMRLSDESPAPLINQGSPLPPYDTTEVAVLTLLGALVQQVAAPPNPLQRFEQLQALADHDWRPGTSELAAILGLKSLSGQTFERYGFRFTRVGKNGVQSAWQVEKR